MEFKTVEINHDIASLLVHLTANPDYAKFMSIISDELAEREKRYFGPHQGTDLNKTKKEIEILEGALNIPRELARRYNDSLPMKDLLNQTPVRLEILGSKITWNAKDLEERASEIGESMNDKALREGCEKFVDNVLNGRGEPVTVKQVI